VRSEELEVRSLPAEELWRDRSQESGMESLMGMSGKEAESNSVINEQMTILDVVSQFRATEKVFKKYDKEAGTCLCCEALFEPLWKVAQEYGLELDRLLNDLRQAAKVW